MTHLVKLNGVFPQSVADTFAHHAERLYGWESVLALVEFRPIERMEPRPDIDDKVGSVLIRVMALEVASKAQEGHLRSIQQAMYRIRTGAGTLDEVTGDNHRTLELGGAVLLDQAGSPDGG